MFKFSKEYKEFIKQNWFLGIPILIESIIQSSMYLIDSIMIGQLGAESITAINIVGQIQFLIIVLVASLSSGVSIFVGQYNGSNDKRMIKQTLKVAYISTSVISLLAFFIMFIFSYEVLSFYTNYEGVLQQGVIYLKVISITFLFFPLTRVTSTALKSIGETKIPMKITVISLLCNIFFNAIFIIGLNMGVLGAGIGTLLARVVEIILIFLFVFIKKIDVFMNLNFFSGYDKDFVKMYFEKVSFILLGQIIWSFGATMYTVSYKYVDLASQTSLYIVRSMTGIFMSASGVIGTLATIVMANVLGSNDIDKSIIYSRWYMRLSILVSLLCSTLFIISMPYLILFYNIPDDIVQLSYKIGLVYMFLIVVQMYNYTNMSGIIRSGGNARFDVKMNIIAGWCLGIPLSFILTINTNLPMHLIILFSIGVEETAKALISTKYIKSNKWANCLTT